MPAKRIAMIGAGAPGFPVKVAEELVRSEVLGESTFALMDIDAGRLDAAAARIQALVEEAGGALRIEATTDRRRALDGASHVVTSCEPQRVPLWTRDLEIPAAHGVHQLTGENGGPGGQAHAMRNITLFMAICADMRELCPDAWLMNFTNPMSFLCTYAHRFGGVKTMGFCHQVHGSFGVIAEMLGFEPGQLEVITAGVNHFNWLLDIRHRGTGESYYEQFLKSVRQSRYWQRVRTNMPMQRFTLEILEVFRAYPVGYDDHIAEYVPFFYEPDEWESFGYTSHIEHLQQVQQRRDAADGTNPYDKQLAASADEHYPFPRDPGHPYYIEHACLMMEALETNTPTYTDAINIVNGGSVSNLPHDAVVDIPAVAVGGRVRGLDVGALPKPAAELCRRQITIHEMVVDATVHGDRQLALQAMCLDPYIRSITQARRILADFLSEYRDYLPQFQ